MKHIMDLPIGTKLIVTKVAKDDGWYMFSEDIVGHEFIKSDNGNYSYINLPESINQYFDKNKGYYFHSAQYEII